MSNPNWPNQPKNSPWAQQDPRWQPPKFHDPTGRDPNQPFGTNATPPPGATSIDAYRPPKSGGKGWLIVLAVVLIAGVLLLLLQFRGEDTTAAATAYATPTQLPSVANPDGTSVPFEGNGTGTFSILKSKWVDDYLEVTFRIEMDSDYQGTFNLFLYRNDDLTFYDPMEIDSIVASGDKPFEGTVHFSAPEVPSTLVLSANHLNRALAALPISP